MLKKLWTKALWQTFLTFGFFTVIAVLLNVASPILDQILKNEFVLFTLVIILIIFSFIAVFKIYSRITPQDKKAITRELIKKTSERFGEFPEETKDLMQSITNEELVATEERLKKKIELLKNIPIEAAEYFKELIEQSLERMQKRSLFRDIIMFVLGIVAAILIGILVK